MKLQTFIVGATVAIQLVTACMLLYLDRAAQASLATAVAAVVGICVVSAFVAHRLMGRGLAAPLHELVVLAHQIAQHRDVPRLRGRIREIELLEDSLRRVTAELSAGNESDGAVLTSHAAHELRSSLGAVKNALYYVKEICQEHRLSEKDKALEEIFTHATIEIEKAARIATPESSKSAKGGSRSDAT